MAWAQDVNELTNFIDSLPNVLQREAQWGANECLIPELMRTSDLIGMINAALENPDQVYLREEVRLSTGKDEINLDKIRHKGKLLIFTEPFPQDISEDRLDLMLRTFTRSQLCNIVSQIAGTWINELARFTAPIECGLSKQELLMLINQSLEDPSNEHWRELPPGTNPDEARRKTKILIIGILTPENITEDQLDTMLAVLTPTQLCTILTELADPAWF